MEDIGFFLLFREGKYSYIQRKLSQNITVVIGVREGTLYRLQGNHVQYLVHESDNLCEIWHRRLGHLHYREFTILRGIVIGLLEFSIEK
jgi:hypothetical protein